MLAAAGVALDLGRTLVSHGNDNVVGVFAALGAAGFDRITGRKCGALHSGTPLLGTSQDVSNKNQEDRWKLWGTLDNWLVWKTRHDHRQGSSHRNVITVRVEGCYLKENQG
jgi:hypothetical protein